MIFAKNKLLKVDKHIAGIIQLYYNKLIGIY